MRNLVRVVLAIGALWMLVGTTGCASLTSSKPFEVRIRIVGVDTVGGITYLVDNHEYDIEAETFTQGGSRLDQYRTYDDYEWGSTDTNVAFLRATQETIKASNPGSCTITATLKGQALVGALAVQVN